MEATKISMTDDDVKHAAARDMLNEGWYKFLITENKAGLSKKDHFMLTLTCWPLKDPDDPNTKGGSGLKHWVVLPMKNPDVEGHVPPKAWRGCGFARALEGDDKIPQFPRYEGGSLVYKGKDIGKGQEDASREKVVKEALKVLVGYYNSPVSLENESFFGLVKHEDGEARINKLEYELPGDAVLVDGENFLGKANKSNGASNGATNGRRTRTRATASSGKTASRRTRSRK